MQMFQFLLVRLVAKRFMRSLSKRRGFFLALGHDFLHKLRIEHLCNQTRRSHANDMFSLDPAACSCHKNCRNAHAEAYSRYSSRWRINRPGRGRDQSRPATKQAIKQKGSRAKGGRQRFFVHTNELKENPCLSWAVYPASRSILDSAQSARNVCRCIRVDNVPIAVPATEQGAMTCGVTQRFMVFSLHQTGKIAPMTRPARYFVSCCILLLATALVPRVSAARDDGQLWQAVARGGHVLLMRHAQAPGGGDPAGFRLDDCATQRNLDSEGQGQARRIGDAFRRAGVTQAQVFSSRWCRCLETGQLLALGKVIPLPALDSFFSNPEREREQTSEVLAWIKAADLSTPLVLVTHQVNITALTRVFPGSGEIVVARSMPDGKLLVVGRLKHE